MIGMRATIRGLGVISMLILARLLEPADFGLVALATLVMGLVETAGQFGFDSAIIQNQNADHEHYNSAWTLNVIRGLVSALALVAVAQPAAGFFNEPRLVEIIYWLAVASALSGFQNIGIVDFRRDLTFDKEYRFFVFIKLASFFTTLIVAFVWRSYWALVAGIVMRSVMMLALSYAMHPYRPRFGLSRAGELFKFSKWLLVNEYLVYGAGNVDRLLIGRFLNAASLGVYSLAKEIATLLSAELVLPITRAMYPGYAKISGDPERLKEMFLNTIGLVFLFSWPLAFGIAAVAEPFVLVVLGEKWIQVVEILPYLAIGGVFTFAWVNIGPLFMAVGKPELATVAFIISAVLRITVLVGGYYWNGLIGVAQATVIAPMIGFPFYYFLLRKVIDLDLRTYFRSIWRSIAASVLMFLAVSWLDGILPVLPEAIRLTVLTLTGTAFFVGAQLILWRLSKCPVGAEAHVLALARERLNARYRCAP
jgi:lipopolysaccharide exporter